MEKTMAETTLTKNHMDKKNGKTTWKLVFYRASIGISKGKWKRLLHSHNLEKLSSSTVQPKHQANAGGGGGGGGRPHMDDLGQISEQGARMVQGLGSRPPFKIKGSP